MPITKLDPNCALIVIDLQKGIVAMPAEGMTEVVRRAASLADAFRQHGRLVVLVHVTAGAPGRVEQALDWSRTPSDFADFVPELQPQAEDLVVTKRTWGAFMHTSLHEDLKKRGITQVVIVGVATSLGVESTARQAYELGFNVALAIDAMTDLTAQAHANSVGRIFPKLGETGSATDVIALL